MRVCPACQTSNSDDALYCQRCGSSIAAMPDAAAHAGPTGAWPEVSPPDADPEELNRRAISHIARDEIPDALDLVNQALAIDPAHQASIRTRVHILNRIGLTSQAAVEGRLLEAVDQGVVYAGFWRRFGAYFVDGLITTALSIVPGAIVVAAIYFSIVPDNPTQQEEEDALNTAVLGYYAVSAIVTFLYLWIGNARGGTWGKAAFGISVLSAHDGTPIGLSRSFLRYLIGLLGAGALYLGWFWMIWDQKKQTWHDKAAGSVVVRTKG